MDVLSLFFFFAIRILHTVEPSFNEPLFQAGVNMNRSEI